MSVRRVAIAGLGTIANEAQGVQVGAFNIAMEEVEGVQIGVVNYAGRLKGIQLGLINISAENGLPVMPVFNAGW